MARESWTDERLDDLSKRVDDGFRDTKEEFALLRSGMRSEFASVRAEFGSVRAEIDGLRSDTRAEFGAVRAEIGGVRKEISRLQGEIASLNRTLALGFAGIAASVIGAALTAFVAHAL